ncbi:hypothetical protein D3C85_1679450 [compost metagenome]
MAEAVAGLLAGIAHAPQGHVEGHVAPGLGAVVAAGEQQGIDARHPVQLLQGLEGLAGQRHGMRAALLHAIGGDHPQPGLAVELIPAGFA